jgi:hypothetical protein
VITAVPCESTAIVGLLTLRSPSDWLARALPPADAISATATTSAAGSLRFVLPLRS